MRRKIDVYVPVDQEYLTCRSLKASGEKRLPLTAGSEIEFLSNQQRIEVRVVSVEFPVTTQGVRLRKITIEHNTREDPRPIVSLVF